MMKGPTREDRMTTQSFFFLSPVIFGCGSFAAAFAWAEYCSI
jgi:hypothetical protein